ncbi:MAG: potassium/proton antiporter [Chloroflexi bacterium]|nr:potassium/proton antiporter [Chloroflexota bacterium]
MSTSEYALIGFALLLLLGVLTSKISERFGVPALLLFLILGMLAGSDGPGGIYFDDAALAQFVGVTALALILFSGGLDTDWKSIRPVLKYGLILSTLGVLVTSLIVGIFAQVVLRFSLLEGLLLGAIVSSTDAAAVFSVLRSKGINLKGQLKPLLELESGSNDPMAVLLTISLVQLLTQPVTSPTSLILFFILQMSLGLLAGYVIGKGIVFLANHLRLGYEGLYPVLTLSSILFAYGLTNLMGGNGFLAVYLAGVVAGNHDFIHRRSLLRFHDGLAWLMQIAMFLTLGLLVFPSRLLPVMGASLLIALCLMFIARPVSVFTSLLPVRALSVKEKTLVSWVGLRGAVPIVLATFPLLAKIPQADLIFNVVFFIVLTSVLLQGTTIPLVARWLRVDTTEPRKLPFPIEYTPVGSLKCKLEELIIPESSNVSGKAIVELGLPAEFLVVLINRNGEYLIPTGGTTLWPGDVLLTLAEPEVIQQVKSRMGATN